MSGIELLPFQAKASEQIAERYAALVSDERRPLVHRHWEVPFYQALNALTGAGKTPILADAVAQIRASMTTEPIVLWVSKAKAVVDQTFFNFSAGGKYEGLIEGFMVGPLGDLKAIEIADDSVPRIALSTVGAFNQRGRADGTLRVHQVAEDTSDDSLWTTLRDRRASGGRRRSLIIVYDEGHNLSDQQTELLLELEPDVILVASATMRTPARLARLIDRLREYGWDEAKLVTSVDSRAVVDAGLVKKQIVLGGYTTAMEIALDAMLEAFGRATKKSEDLSAGFRPKAIYVCKTNISQDDGTQDNPSRPFVERRAPPILVWRYLTEQKGIDPAEIAVYCDLRFDRRHQPPPEDFVLFSGGEDDFAVFRAGNYRHVIFNLSLQEGWDDPECCFAYIDKSMGSNLQVEQVIGRVLRQPGARHYPDVDLNTADFYIRMDDRQEFPRILEAVRRRIADEAPEIRLDGYTDHRARNRARGEPKQIIEVPEIHIDADEAVAPLVRMIHDIHDYRSDDINTVGKGELIRAIQTVGSAAKAEVETAEIAHSNRVTARWVLRRTVQSLYPEVIKTIDWATGKFDARVELTSPAAKELKVKAEMLVDSYLEYSELAFEDGNPYTVGSVLIDPPKFEHFENAIHEGYSDLNPNELEFARALDAMELLWARNPSNGGYAVPILEKGTTKNFYPDFLVWKDDLIFALDPKGDHLITRAAAHKLMAIRDEKGRRKVVIRLITEGRWTDPVTKTGGNGYTVWAISNSGGIKMRHTATVAETVETCLNKRF